MSDSPVTDLYVQRQQALSEMLTKIRVSVDPEEIFRIVTKELCQLLQADRVSVYQFNLDWGGKFVHDFEYASSNWQRSFQLGRNTAWDDSFLQQTKGGRYRHNESFAVDNIYLANLSPCHLEILEQFLIKAFAIAPIFVGQRLWGLLSAYQHSSFRHWETSDVLFLNQTGAQLGLALQHAELMTQTQKIADRYQSWLRDHLKSQNVLGQPADHRPE